MQIPILAQRGQKRPWGSVPRIDWRNPLTNGLVFYGYDTGTGLILDLVNGLNPAFTTGTRPANKPTARGSGLQYTSGGAALFSGIEGPVNKIFVNGLYSMACAWFITALPSINFTCPFGINDGSGNNASAFLWDSGATNDMQWAIANVNPTPFTGNTVNAYHTLVGVNTSATSQNVYFDGALTTTTALTATFATTTTAPCFNTFTANVTPSGNGVAGWIYYGALWNRRLSSAAALQLHQDPYCFLIYPEDEMFSTLVGSSAFTWLRMDDSEANIVEYLRRNEMVEYG